jgi:hypothetical protein
MTDGMQYVTGCVVGLSTLHWQLIELHMTSICQAMHLYSVNFS